MLQSRVEGLLFSQSSAKRRQAVELLGDLPDEKALRLLQRIINRPASGTRTRLLKAVSGALDTAAAEPLLAAYEGKKVSRTLAVSALSGMKDRLEDDARLSWLLLQSGLAEDVLGPIGSVAVRTGSNKSLLGLYYAGWDDLDKRYATYRIPKKNGGTRVLHAPEPMLKAVQRSINGSILAEERLGRPCHGFRKGRSIVTNAKPHVGREVVLNLDLKDFFPSISAGRVYGVYRSMGLGEGESRFLARLSTYRDRLPQGAPTSPALANLVCRRLDSRLSGLARRLRGRYTRYADDLTFSGSGRIVSALLKIREIISDEGFAVAEHKVRITRQGNRQEVTGLTVNKKVSVPRHVRRLVRAMVNRYEHGRRVTWAGKRIGLNKLKGHVAHIASVHPELGETLMRKIASAG